MQSFRSYLNCAGSLAVDTLESDFMTKNDVRHKQSDPVAILAPGLVHREPAFAGVFLAFCVNVFVAAAPRTLDQAIPVFNLSDIGDDFCRHR